MLRGNPKLLGAWASVLQASGQLKATQGAAWPSLTASLPATLHREKRTIIGDQTDHLFYDANEKLVDGSAELQLDWTVVDFGSLRAQIRSARAQVLASQAQQRTAIESALVTASKSYFDVVTAKAGVESAERAEAYARQNESVASALYASGAAPMSDQLQAKVALSQSHLKLLAARDALRQSTANLAVNMGLTADTSIAVESAPIGEGEVGEITQPDVLVERLRVSNSEIGAAWDKVASARETLRAADVDGLPNIALSATYGPEWLHYPHSNSEVFSFNDVPLDSHIFKWSVQLTIKIPIFDGFARYGRRDAARAALFAAEADLQDVERRVYNATYGYVSSLRLQTESLVEARHVVADAEELYTVALKRYEHRVGTFVDVLNAQSKVYEAEMTQTQVEADLRLARVNLLAAVGMLSEETIE